MYEVGQVIVCALAALGFRRLVLATRLSKSDRKPWSCDTCLCAWGALVCVVLQEIHRLTDFSEFNIRNLALLLVIWLAATGAARWLVRFDSRTPRFPQPPQPHPSPNDPENWDHAT